MDIENIFLFYQNISNKSLNTYLKIMNLFDIYKYVIIYAKKNITRSKSNL